MRGSSSQLRRLVSWAAAPLAMVLAAGLVWQASYAAFSADTRNAGNSWSSGTVALTDDDGGSARFSVTNLIPGQTATACIRVTSTSSVFGPVKLYTLNATNMVGLAEYIKVSVTQGDGGSFSSCTGFVADSAGLIVDSRSLAYIATNYSSYATGVGGWTTAISPESKTYQITYTFDATGLTQEQLDAFQGQHTGIDFEWEIQNN
ncbi:MAG: hypothetical protein ABMA25_04885 [Ilumatobacteraceae bacterium]